MFYFPWILKYDVFNFRFLENFKILFKVRSIQKYSQVKYRNIPWKFLKIPDSTTVPTTVLSRLRFTLSGITQVYGSDDR